MIWVSLVGCGDARLEGIIYAPYRYSCFVITQHSLSQRGGIPFDWILTCRQSYSIRANKLSGSILQVVFAIIAIKNRASRSAPNVSQNQTVARIGEPIQQLSVRIPHDGNSNATGVLRKDAISVYIFPSSILQIALAISIKNSKSRSTRYGRSALYGLSTPNVLQCETFTRRIQQLTIRIHMKQRAVIASLQAHAVIQNDSAQLIHRIAIRVGFDCLLQINTHHPQRVRLFNSRASGQPDQALTRLLSKIALTIHAQRSVTGEKLIRIRGI